MRVKAAIGLESSRKIEQNKKVSQHFGSSVHLTDAQKGNKKVVKKRAKSCKNRNIKE